MREQKSVQIAPITLTRKKANLTLGQMRLLMRPWEIGDPNITMYWEIAPFVPAHLGVKYGMEEISNLKKTK